jgi:hypothetical protein
MYSSFAAYKTHIYRAHIDLLDKTLSEEGRQLDSNTYDDRVIPPTLSNTHLNVDSQTNDIDDQSNETERETDEEIIFWTLLKEQTTRSLDEKIDFETFEKFVL